MRQHNREPTMAASSPATVRYRQITELVEQALAENDLDTFQDAMLSWFQFEQRHDFPDPVLALCATPFQPERLATLPPQIQLYVLQEIFRQNIPRLIDLGPQIEFLLQPEALTGLNRDFQQPFLYLLIVALLLRGETDRAAEIFQRHRRKLGSCGLRGWLLFLADDYPAAVRSFKADLSRLRRREENPAAFFTGFEGIILLLSLLADDNHRHLSLIKTIINDLEAVQPYNPLLPVYRTLGATTDLLENRASSDHQALLAAPPLADDAVTTLFSGLAQLWLTDRLPAAMRPMLQDLGRRARQNNFGWLAAGYDSLLQWGSRRSRNHTPGEQPAFGAEFEAATGFSWNLGGLIRVTEPWRHAILALNSDPAKPERTGPKTAQRLAWLLRYHEDQGRCELKPVMQQRRRDGTWSRGRPVALARLTAAVNNGNPEGHHQTPTAPDDSFYLSLRDRAICASLEHQHQTGGSGFILPGDLDLSLLAGHPHLFLAADPNLRIHLDRGQPALLIEPTSNPDQVQLRLTPHPGTADQVVRRRGETLFQVISYPPPLQNLAARLGAEGRTWPLADRDALINFLAGLPRELTVFSCLDLQLPDSEPITPDNRIILQFFPASSGLRLRMRVRPLGPDGPDLCPGRGPAVLWARINGRRCHLCRDLAAENANAQELADHCQLELPGGAEGNTPDFASWTLPEPGDCLEILTRLHEHHQSVAQEWPVGHGLSVSPNVKLHKLRLKISQKNDWFGLSGKLQLDDGLVMELDTLLRAARHHKDRFIPLGNGRFLSLSRELKRKIEEIEAIGEIRHGEVQLHPLAARLLLKPDDDGDHASGPQVDGDQYWQEFETRLRRNRHQKAPVPAGLNTRLRPYQVTGYRWLRQMADLKLGACLADDMGLGKTIQALALLLARAEGGPGLVVAPTSLCLNWQEEAERFAPATRVIHYSGRNRRRLLDDLGPNDLVICSYGMLQRDSDLTGAIHWHTIVLDEAQAIKNFLAKRSRAAMKLQADFKLITTGTPLENHLTELWTLFRFINPGLLGSLEKFSQQFIVPIEQHDDQQARSRLKKLLTPFILRRLKDEVLSELPPRTDITLQVTMNREEAALYEALRQQAKATLQAPADNQRRGAPLQVLAEIMKLRRACCHPRLVLPDSTMAGAKLELFAKVVQELLENRHRILVFSQFVDHLAIVRGHLDQQGISYQYFDGATPPQTRQQRVQAFQEGQGDLFLISLRAGGLGLNLTAADYVIHLDPWWNPAVEEQASDRAHRIGQNKPVTIYRLITSGTIEEKIRAMHHRKRRLANDLLDGTRAGPPRSYEELMALLEK